MNLTLSNIFAYDIVNSTAIPCSRDVFFSFDMHGRFDACLVRCAIPNPGFRRRYSITPVCVLASGRDSDDTVSPSGRRRVAATNRCIWFQEDSYSDEDSGTEEVSDAED